MKVRVYPLVGLAILMSVRDAQHAQAPADAWFTLNQIGPNVWAAIDNPNAKQRSYSNAGVIVRDDGVVVVDTMTGHDASARLFQEVRRLTNLPVKFVVNTHYHGDHVAGNKLFADAGASVLAHRNVRGWIHSENLRMLGDNAKPELKTFVEQLVAPTVTYTDAVDLYLASRLVQVRSFPGHTGGDSVVIVPDAKVVFGGDLLWKHVTPNTIVVRMDASYGACRLARRAPNGLRLDAVAFTRDRSPWTDSGSEKMPCYTGSMTKMILPTYPTGNSGAHS